MERDFPEDFLWGAATAAHQVEGFNVASDWWAAEEAGLLPHRSGAACRHLERFEEDFELARRYGHNAHRLSLEWARLEPRPGVFDAEAFAHYARVLAALRARGLEPIVTLQHFTLPRWLAERGGWLASDAIERFARYVAEVARALGSGIRWWLTVNEPTVLAKHGYVTGDWPPFRRGRWDLAMRVIARMIAAHESAYRVLHEILARPLVSFAHSLPWIEPCDPGRWRDRAAAALRRWFLCDSCFWLVRERGRPLLDFVAVNYYTRSIVRWRARGRALFFGVDCVDPHHGDRRRFDELGQEVWPEGLYRTLCRCARLGLPILVTENGIATTDDGLRIEHLSEHLRALARARAEGVDVRGYLYWTLFDNYEWARGFTAHFGLAALDPENGERRPRPAMELFARVARSGRLPRTEEAGEAA
ncbi:MAG: family 1 glycosylhydrolase [Geminicoccaceae bacterium]|nr:family 1 glycosylhydrolase [Geminicoccaceae bacterium]